jgi:uncharacterized integral membrane protein
MEHDADSASAQPSAEVAESTASSAHLKTADDASRPIPSTRAARTWVRILPTLVLLALSVDFVLQNPRDTKVTFLGLSGQPPLSVALLAAAALGALVVLALGSIRILQLRSLIRRGTSSRRQRTPLERGTAVEETVPASESGTSEVGGV